MTKNSLYEIMSLKSLVDNNRTRFNLFGEDEKYKNKYKQPFSQPPLLSFFYKLLFTYLSQAN